MKKAGKRLFRRLGELRDVHVMQEWVHRLDSPGRSSHRDRCCNSSPRARPRCNRKPCRRLQEFDRKQWQRWSRFVAPPDGTIPARKPGFPSPRSRALDRTPTDSIGPRIRNRSQAGFHRLRIGIKRFRYIVENFLPDQHAAWSDDLKQVQDLLGDVHDLDVLWSVAARANVFPDADARTRWQSQNQ